MHPKPMGECARPWRMWLQSVTQQHSACQCVPVRIGDPNRAWGTSPRSPAKPDGETPWRMRNRDTSSSCGSCGSRNAQLFEDTTRRVVTRYPAHGATTHGGRAAQVYALVRGLHAPTAGCLRVVREE